MEFVLQSEAKRENKHGAAAQTPAGGGGGGGGCVGGQEGKYRAVSTWTPSEAGNFHLNTPEHADTRAQVSRQRALETTTVSDVRNHLQPVFIRWRSNVKLV